MVNIPIISVMAGASGSGKTTLLIKLLPKLHELGLRVGVVKHACHINIPNDGMDSSRIAETGVAAVAIVSPTGSISITRPLIEPSLTEMAASFTDVDLVIAEGYKNIHFPKIEILRKGCYDKIYSPLDELLVVMTDMPKLVPKGIKYLPLDAVDELVFIIINWLKAYKEAQNG
ncbi:MAG: molybdopterin-guanine dinucleotide biosynthesis protein B [Clostridia bacterium]|jgi:molybdopterin-guanine dinucleotide biosynthesis protein MobB|nr:molybdopterin-guanine dinucleotide biosynthesis protein B [Clostridia bacterium]